MMFKTILAIIGAFAVVGITAVSIVVVITNKVFHPKDIEEINNHK